MKKLENIFRKVLKNCYSEFYVKVENWEQLRLMGTYTGKWHSVKKLPILVRLSENGGRNLFPIDHPTSSPCITFDQFLNWVDGVPYKPISIKSVNWVCVDGYEEDFVSFVKHMTGIPQEVYLGEFEPGEMVSVCISPSTLDAYNVELGRSHENFYDNFQIFKSRLVTHTNISWRETLDVVFNGATYQTINLTIPMEKIFYKQFQEGGRVFTISMIVHTDHVRFGYSIKCPEDADKKGLAQNISRGRAEKTPFHQEKISGLLNGKVFGKKVADTMIEVVYHNIFKKTDTFKRRVK